MTSEPPEETPTLTRDRRSARVRTTSQATPVRARAPRTGSFSADDHSEPGHARAHNVNGFLRPLRSSPRKSGASGGRRLYARSPKASPAIGSGHAPLYLFRAAQMGPLLCPARGCRASPIHPRLGRPPTVICALEKHLDHLVDQDPCSTVRGIPSGVVRTRHGLGPPDWGTGKPRERP